MRQKTKASRSRRAYKFATSKLDAIQRRQQGEDIRYVRRPYQWDNQSFDATRKRERLYLGERFSDSPFNAKSRASQALIEKWKYPRRDPFDSSAWGGYNFNRFKHWREQATAKGVKSRAGRPIYNKYDKAKYKASITKSYKKVIKPGLLRWAHRAKRAIKTKQKKAKLLRKDTKRTRRFARRHM